jgi:hypothetical protein
MLESVLAGHRRDLRSIFCSTMLLLVFGQKAFSQQAGQFDLMLDYQAMNYSNVSVHPGAFLHFSPVISTYRLDFILGADLTLSDVGTEDVTIFQKFGGYWTSGQASYWVVGGSVYETVVYFGAEHQYRFFSRRHFACLANVQLFLPLVPNDIDVPRSSTRFASAGVLVRIF